MTTLEAVNYALKRCGLSEVAALETGTTSPAGEMEKLLNETNLDIQSQNWHFNRRRNVTVSPNSQGRILIAITGSITGISAADPTVVTCASHGLSDGLPVYFSGTNSTPALVGPYLSTRVDANTFTVPVNVTVSGNTGTFSTWGGTIIEMDCDDESRDVVVLNDRLYDLTNSTDIFEGDITLSFTAQLAWSLIPVKVQMYIAAETAVVYNDAHGMRERAPALIANARVRKGVARAADTRTGDINILDSQNVRDTRGRLPIASGWPWGIGVAP